MELMILWFGSAILAAIVASSKGRSGGGYFLLAMILPLIGLLAAALMPSLKAPPGIEVPTPQTHIKCPDCAELIRKEARVCKHCGCKLIPQ